MTRRPQYTPFEATEHTNQGRWPPNRHGVQAMATRCSTSLHSSPEERLPETYQWLLAPVQATPQAPVDWQAIRLSGQDALAARASKKLRSDELLLTGFAATRLRMELDRVPLWRGDSVGIKQLVEDFARYLYLPRLKEPGVLLQSIGEGLALLTWAKDSFAFAESYDEFIGQIPRAALRPNGGRIHGRYDRSSRQTGYCQDAV